MVKRNLHRSLFFPTIDLMRKQSFSIILFYQYVKISNPKKFRDEQFAMCTQLGLRGRTIVATEGVNGTLEGETKAINKYCREMKKDRRFRDVVFKKSVGTGKNFPRLSVKVRSELVTLGKPIKNFWKKNGRGTYMKPADLRQAIKSGEKIKIIDMRNAYETEVGNFENSALPPMQNFRDLPKVLPQLNQFKNDKVVTVCTGGIRCEKASAYLKQKGFKNVYQLDGGIVSYMKKYPSRDFKGSLYVFDGRITMHFDKKAEHVVVGKCALCDTPSERYVNCSNDLCHVHFICCERCDKGMAVCGKKCETRIRVNEKVYASRI